MNRDLIKLYLFVLEYKWKVRKYYSKEPDNSFKVEVIGSTGYSKVLTLK